jgi:hypothetical protein
MANGDIVKTSGKITVNFTAKGSNGDIKGPTTFYVLDSHGAWRVILGLPWLHALKAHQSYEEDVLRIKTDVNWLLFPNVNARLNVPTAWMITDNDSTTPERPQKVWETVLVNPKLSKPCKAKVESVIKKHHMAFALKLTDVTPSKMKPHTIKVKDGAVLPRGTYRKRFSEKEMVECHQQVKTLLGGGMISPIAPQDIKCISPIVMAPKKDGLRTSHDEIMTMIANALEGRENQRPLTDDPKLLRLCQNFFVLNQATEIPPFYPGDLNSKVANHSGRKYRMKLDATSGFFNVKLDPESRPYTAMFVEGMGFFAWNVMPMGLTGAPTTYQLGMHEALEGLIGPGRPLDIWMDDIYGSADTFEELLEVLDKLLERVEQWGIKLAPKKSELFFDNITIGGQLVSEHGVSPDPSKVLAIAEFPRPTTTVHKELCNDCRTAFGSHQGAGQVQIQAIVQEPAANIDSQLGSRRRKRLQSN